jgi:hypothetical protein
MEFELDARLPGTNAGLFDDQQSPGVLVPDVAHGVAVGRVVDLSALTVCKLGRTIITTHSGRSASL